MQLITFDTYLLEAEASVPYFGLYESINGNSIDDVTNMDKCVLEIVESWTAIHGVSNEVASKFVFMIRLFMPSINGLGKLLLLLLLLFSFLLLEAAMAIKVTLSSRHLVCFILA